MEKEPTFTELYDLCISLSDDIREKESTRLCIMFDHFGDMDISVYFVNNIETICRYHIECVREKIQFAITKLREAAAFARGYSIAVHDAEEKERQKEKEMNAAAEMTESEQPEVEF